MDDLRAVSLHGGSPSKNCFIGLYRELMAMESEAALQMSETVLRAFSIENGTFKRTSSKRTVEFDREVLDVLGASGAPRNRHIVHDMGVSDARNSCEFFDSFASCYGAEPEFFATDLCFAVTAVRRQRTRTTIVIDRSGNILQIMFPPFVLSCRVGLRDYCCFPLNVFLRSALMTTSVRKTLRLYKGGDPSVIGEAISLVCPEAHRLATCNARFHLEEHSAFDQSRRKYTVVRTMNLLNQSYFSDALIAKAVSNVLESLSEDGVFIIGSNGDSGSAVNGAVYLKRQNRFHRIYASGKGSEVDPIILKAGAH